MLNQRESSSLFGALHRVRAVDAVSAAVGGVHRADLVDQRPSCGRFCKTRQRVPGLYLAEISRLVHNDVFVLAS